MPPPNATLVKEWKQRAQSLFIDTTRFASALKWTGVGLGVLGLIGVCAGVLRGPELVIVGLAVAGLGYVLFIATNYFVSLSAVAAATLEAQLAQLDDAPAPGSAPGSGISSATETPSAAPAIPARKPPQELPPIPLAGDEEKPS